MTRRVYYNPSCSPFAKRVDRRPDEYQPKRPKVTADFIRLGKAEDRRRRRAEKRRGND